MTAIDSTTDGSAPTGAGAAAAPPAPARSHGRPAPATVPGPVPAGAAPLDAAPAPTTPAPRRARTVLGSVLANPLVGLAPWILYSVVEGPNRLELSAALALGLAVVILFANWFTGSKPKMLEYSDVAYFAALAVLVEFASAGTRTWLELWGGEVANLVLFGIVLGSVLVRQPFTLPYAKESTPEEVWHTPEFMRVNYLITWAWVAAFAIEAASGLFGDAVLHDSNNLWTGWIIQTFPMIVAAQFTIWYPARLDALREGRRSEAPNLADFGLTITPWIVAIGIISLSADGGPSWLGIGLIVLGVGLAKALSPVAHDKAGPSGVDGHG